MAIGTMAAIGLAAAGAGSAIGGIAKGKAAKKAAALQQQTASDNNALALNIYSKNEGYLAPYAQQGLGATSALNDFYGLSQPAQPMQQTMQQPNALAQFQPQSYGFEGMDGPMGGYGREGAGRGFNGEPSFTMPGVVTGFGGGTYDIQGNPVTVGTQGQPAPQAPGDPFKRFIQNSDYAFQFGEGANRVNSGFAGAGTLQSGAAMKALEDYRQNLQKGYRGEWAAGVANQQGVGLTGASALAGVGQNYANSVMANNNNAADARGNAMLYKGANNPLASGLGMIGGGLFKLGGK